MADFTVCASSSQRSHCIALSRERHRHPRPGNQPSLSSPEGGHERKEKKRHKEEKKEIGPRQQCNAWATREDPIGKPM
uniref:Uncharacterized protein n=1 Tax=Oryza brachyantha TaxID=4533 RepID=J3N0W5_ORYBR